MAPNNDNDTGEDAPIDADEQFAAEIRRTRLSQLPDDELAALRGGAGDALTDAGNDPGSDTPPGGA